MECLHICPSFLPLVDLKSTSLICDIITLFQWKVCEWEVICTLRKWLPHFHPGSQSIQLYCKALTRHWICLASTGPTNRAEKKKSRKGKTYFGCIIAIPEAWLHPAYCSIVPRWTTSSLLARPPPFIFDARRCNIKRLPLRPAIDWAAPDSCQVRVRRTKTEAFREALGVVLVSS